MTSLRVLGADRLVTLMEAERGSMIALVDLGFLLYGGCDLSAEIAVDLVREKSRRPERG